jgi:GAF domain-containing protein
MDTIKVPVEPDINRLNIPITLRGQLIGNITFTRKSNTNWTEADRALAIEIAHQVSLALENARLLEEAQRRAAQEQSLNELTAQLSRSLDVDTLLQTALRELHQLPDVIETSVYVSTHTPSSGSGN